jgi:hypothetical protein
LRAKAGRIAIREAPNSVNVVVNVTNALVSGTSKT